MGGPPITFPTPNFLIRTILRKVAFYAPLPHFENPCLLAQVDEAVAGFSGGPIQGWRALA